VRGGIAEEALSGYHSVSGGVGLARSECAHSREHGSVDSSSIIQEGAYYDLEVFGLGLGSRARSIYGWNLRLSGAEFGGDINKWGFSRFNSEGTDLGQELGNIAGVW
jgi:hypothetical protein